jgi:plasmid maintenance system antidote protein VapI
MEKKNRVKIHIGEIICQKLKAEGRTKKWLAEQVHCNQSNFCKLLQKPTMDTDLLMRISFALQDNFFSHLSNYCNDNQQVKNNIGK